MSSPFLLVNLAFNLVLALSLSFSDFILDGAGADDHCMSLLMICLHRFNGTLMICYSVYRQSVDVSSRQQYVLNL